MPQNTRPLVSVIVPCYKVEQYLSNCIESVTNQSYNNWELILVDDGSPDASGHICDEYADKDKRIRVIHKENGGLSSARNAGMKIMRGDFITFLDSDDFLHKDAIMEMMNLAIKYDAQIVQCDYAKGRDKRFPDWNREETICCYDNHSIFTKFAAKIILWGKIYKRELLDGIVMPEGIINEDDWTTWKIYYRATKIIVTSRPLYYYTINPNSIMSNASKRPDTTYYGAYNERILFFSKKGEKDLEEISRLQFCKSLLLSYSNNQLSEKQHTDIRRRFKENWQILRGSHVTPVILKMLFYGFTICPMLISKAAAYKIKK